MSDSRLKKSLTSWKVLVPAPVETCPLNWLSAVSSCAGVKLKMFWKFVGSAPPLVR